MTKSINFGAGPSALPRSTLDTIHKELFNWQNTGLSILETGHRTPVFNELAEKLEASVRRILKVPNHFAILFLPGGAQVQFAMAVMNLVKGFHTANYVETGHWSALAMKEGQKYIKIHCAASSRSQNFSIIPRVNSWDVVDNAAFLHFTDNETIGGVEFASIPQLSEIPLVSDMSSNIFSRPIDFNYLGCIYACAQKNLGIAGMSLVIVRRDLLDRALPETPSVFHYARQETHKSLYSTPTTFAWYLASLILDWLEKEGGVEHMAKQNLKKSQLLYNYIDSSEFYCNSIETNCRSRMNVPFRLINSELEMDFFKEAKEQGLFNLPGHRTVGGARASLYNAISVKDVELLIEFMKYFATQSK